MDLEEIKKKLVLYPRDIEKILGCKRTKAYQMCKLCKEKFNGKAGITDGVKSDAFLKMLGY